MPGGASAAVNARAGSGRAGGGGGQWPCRGAGGGGRWRRADACYRTVADLGGRVCAATRVDGGCGATGRGGGVGGSRFAERRGSDGPRLDSIGGESSESESGLPR